MAGRLLLYDEEARRALQEGIDILARAVRVTMGPCGRMVVFDRGFGTPVITRDGVTVAREIGLADPRQEAGVQLLRHAATRANDLAGDGTTTATVLAQEIVREGLRALAAGASPLQLAQGIEAATKAVVAALREAALPATSRASLAQVATIAAVDAEIGATVAEALDRVGRDGVVTVEDGRSLQTEVEYVEGMQLPNGYLSPGLVTDEGKMQALLDDPYVLVTAQRISTVAEALAILGVLLSSDRRDLFIVAEDVDGEALATLLLNVKKGVARISAIRAPEVGTRRKHILQDIATLTGGHVVSGETGLRLTAVRDADFGDCKRVIVEKERAILIGGQGEATAIASRIAQLKAELAETDYFYDRDKLRERLARLVSGVAVIRPGAASEVEMKEKKLRYEDALAAARAARDEGIVPGGGVAYLNACAALDMAQSPLEGDAATGAAILRRALEAPIRQIAANAGAEGPVVVAGVQLAQEEHGSTNWGYDAACGCYVDMVAAGIVDAAMVARVALESGSSAARMILTTSAMVTDWPA
jgi:chaperonin GroEL